MNSGQRLSGPRASAWALLIGLACLGPWEGSVAQGAPAGLEASMSMRKVIGGSRDVLANMARQMAAAGQPLDIEQMFEQTESDDGPQGPRKAAPVDPVSQTLGCPALNARVKKLDAAIEAKLTEGEQRTKALDARMAATSAANAAKQKAQSAVCMVNPLACIASGLLSHGSDAALAAQEAALVAETSSLDALRAGFDPLLRESTVAVYHLERKACK